MSLIYQSSQTVAITTGSTNQSGNMSTYLNGFISSVYIGITTAMGAGEKVILSAAGSTAKVILTVADPSTDGEYYYPRALIQNTTGATIPSSQGTLIPLFRERVQYVIVSSSPTAGNLNIKVNTF